MKTETTTVDLSEDIQKWLRVYRTAREEFAAREKRNSPDEIGRNYLRQRQKKLIRAQNDLFRRSLQGGCMMMTAGVQGRGAAFVVAALSAIRSFKAFDADNDPHREHDFGSIEIGGERIFWKIDYYDTAMLAGSEDPADPDLTTRVLTIMFAQEY